MSVLHRFRIVFPFAIHIPVVAAVTVFMFMIHGHHFYPGFRVGITRSIDTDGTTYRLPGYVILQSDITTIIATFASLSRTICMWEAGGIMWRCSLLFMEQGGISLKGVKRILTGRPLYPRHLTVKRHYFVFSLLLMANFILDFSSTVLSGSISWKPALNFVPSDGPLLKVPHNKPGNSLESYKKNPNTVIATSVAMGDVTWGTLGTNSRSMTRVLQSANFLSIGSTLQNITVPYFFVDNFEWIKDPDATLTSQQKTLLVDDNIYNPYVDTTVDHSQGLIPDERWGPLTTNLTPGPHFVSEKRILSLRLTRTTSQPGGLPRGCDKYDEALIPSDVGQYHHLRNTTDECFVFAQVTYRAGVALCANCALTAPAVIQQSPSSLTLAPDSLTGEALAIAPYVGMTLLASGWAYPDDFPTVQDRAVEFLSRSYQSAWNALTDNSGEHSLATNLTLSVKTTEAHVTKWRVLLWVLLHLFPAAAKLFFYADHRSTSYPWLDSPPFDALFLDTEELRNVCDSWNPDEKLPDVMLKLADANSRRRRIVVDARQKL